jgi:hypothetical protein
MARKPRGMLSFLYNVYYDPQNQSEFSDGKMDDRAQVMRRFGLSGPRQDLVIKVGGDETQVMPFLQETVLRQLKLNFNKILTPYEEGEH